MLLPSISPFLIRPNKPALSSGRVCHISAAFIVLGGILGRKTGQIIRRGSSTLRVGYFTKQIEKHHLADGVRVCACDARIGNHYGQALGARYGYIDSISIQYEG